MAMASSKTYAKTWARWRRSAVAYLFLLPALIVYGVFLVYPLINTFSLSLHEWDGAQPVKQFVGLKNYERIVHDRKAIESLSHNVGWLVVGTAIPIILGLVLAVLLWQHTPGRLVFQTVYFMPAVMPLVVAGIVWGWIYNPIFGALNSLLESIGLETWTRGWLADPDIALWATIVVGAWTWFGICTTMFMAGLQSVDIELIEAATIDGANSVQRFFYVIIPQLRYVITMVMGITLIGGFKVFDIVFVMTQGGPGNRTEVIATYIYRTAFRLSRYGYGAALSVTLTVLVLITSFIYLRLRERGDQ
jgi:ABC-type sugar transport system permease subunit